MNQIRVCVSLWCLAAGKPLHFSAAKNLKQYECSSHCFSRKKHIAFVAWPGSNLLSFLVALFRLLVMKIQFITVKWLWIMASIAPFASLSLPQMNCLYTREMFFSCLHFNWLCTKWTRPNQTLRHLVCLFWSVCLTLDMYWFCTTAVFGEQ